MEFLGTQGLANKSSAAGYRTARCCQALSSRLPGADSWDAGEAAHRSPAARGVCGGNARARLLPPRYCMMIGGPRHGQMGRPL